MTGPHQSIICFFTATGQGAAAWIATSSDDTSRASRTSSGSLSMRMNMVGTHWLWVTRCRSMSSSAWAASKCSITTTVDPTRWKAMQKRSGAAWYSGAGDRYTLSAEAANRPTASMYTPSPVPSGASGRGTSTPLGCPVVPDE
jgi:hypothetical protein